MMRSVPTSCAFGLALWLLISNASCITAAAQSSDHDAIEALRGTSVSLLDVGMRELRLYVEEALDRNHPHGFSPVRPTVFMLSGTDDIWIDIGYAPDSLGTAPPDCKALLTETARLIIRPDPSLPLTDSQQPGIFRIEEMFASSMVGIGGITATDSGDSVIRHIRLHIVILDASRKAEQSHCKARLLDL